MSFGCRRFKDRIGILLAQVGSPDAPDPSSLRRYLKQFLSDRRVIEVNRVLWWFILNLVILNTRPKRSAQAYARIWGKSGSPLLEYSAAQATLLKNQLRDKGYDFEVEIGMGYGSPSITSSIDKLIAAGVSRLVLMPMYPQYAAATTASAYDAVFSHMLKRRWVPTLRVVEPYYLDAGYLNAVAHRINTALMAEVDAPEYLLLSFHGLPASYVQKGDPYCCMCTETAKALIKRIKLPSEKIVQCFQSRFGKEAWLTPYTDQTVIDLAKSGAKRIMVAAPGFTADCLETLDELGNELHETFIEHGGQELKLIPCLNDDPPWIEAMKDIVLRSIMGWDLGSAESCIACPAKLDVT